MKTPLLIPIPDTFEAYLASISKHARYEYKQAMRAGAEHGCEYRQATPSHDYLEYWMQFWTTQTVGGKHPNWGQWTPQKALALPNPKVFAAAENAHTAYQLLEVCDSYAYAWPVMYDKVRHPWAAKFMWFNLIRWCIESAAWLPVRIEYLDLGGGNGRGWQELIQAYRAGLEKSYKWLYVPTHIKDGELWASRTANYRVFVCGKCGWRQIGGGRCNKCAR